MLMQKKIARGPRAKRQDLPPAALPVHQVAAEAIAEQNRINDEILAQKATEPQPSSGFPNKGKYAWVRLHPGEDTGFTPKGEGKRKRKPSNKETSAQDLDAQDQHVTSPEKILPSMFQQSEAYVSPYA